MLAALVDCTGVEPSGWHLLCNHVTANGEWGFKTNKGVNEQRLGIHLARVRTIRPKRSTCVPVSCGLTWRYKTAAPLRPLWCV